MNQTIQREIRHAEKRGKRRKKEKRKKKPKQNKRKQTKKEREERTTPKKREKQEDLIAKGKTMDHPYCHLPFPNACAPNGPSIFLQSAYTYAANQQRRAGNTERESVGLGAHWVIYPPPPTLQPSKKNPHTLFPLAFPVHLSTPLLPPLPTRKHLFPKRICELAKKKKQK